ncbi:MAG: hypothetical protein MN733_03920, partial [Nitrososphaera sp.]|nr:hypothetical protein [Nitrososphaera sp.]
DMQFFECMTWAEEKLGITREKWVQTKLDDDRIELPIRHSGKKNANGQRIKTRADHRRFVAEVKDVKLALRGMLLSIYQIQDDPEMEKLYREKVKPKLDNQRR